MKPFQFLSLFALALLTACEPNQEVVTPHNTPAKAAARVASATDSYGQMSLSYGSKYDSGKTPSVAINSDGNMVEVHKSQNTDYLYYRTAKVLPGATSIQWSGSKNLDNNLGKDPAVALGKEWGIVMWASDGTLKYKTGSIKDGNFSFWYYTRYLDVGNTVVNNLSVAVSKNPDNQNNPFIVVTFDSNNKLYMLLGQFSGAQIIWQVDYKNNLTSYGEGYDPTIAFNDNGQLIEMHGMNVNGDRRLYARVGKWSYKGDESSIYTKWIQSVSWQSDPIQYTTGVRPSVALDNAGNVVTLHTSYSEIHRIVGYIRDGKYYNTIYNTTLRRGEYSSVSLAPVGGRTQVVANIDDGSKQLYSATNAF